jgi:hypothetical protein
MPKEQYASEFPLPGGVEQYYQTLVSMLKAIRDGHNTAEKMNVWIRQHFEAARGDTAIAGYLNTLQRQGFWRSEDGSFIPSKLSLDILEANENKASEARHVVFETKHQVIAGYEEMLRFLDGGPKAFDEVDRSLQQALGVSWQSKNQTMFRLNWLRSLGYVQKDGQRYMLTAVGGETAKRIAQPPPPPPPPPPPDVDNPKLIKARSLAGELEDRATQGGKGDAFEKAVGDAFEFLGFESKVVGGSGNPDVLVEALLGKLSYRVLVDAKSRSGGVVMQNDVNFESLRAQKEKSAAKHVAVVGPDFSGGNLENWAKEKSVRLIRVEEIKKLMLAHAVCPMPLDAYVPFFKGGGATDDGVLASLLAESENTLQMMQAARSVYEAVREHQDSDASVDVNSLFFILKQAYSPDIIETAVAFLRSPVIGAVEQTETGSLYTRLSPAAMLHHLDRLKNTLGPG